MNTSTITQAPVPVSQLTDQEKALLGLEVMERLVAAEAQRQAAAVQAQEPAAEPEPKAEEVAISDKVPADVQFAAGILVKRGLSSAATALQEIAANQPLSGQDLASARGLLLAALKGPIYWTVRQTVGQYYKLAGERAAAADENQVQNQVFAWFRSHLNEAFAKLEEVERISAKFQHAALGDAKHHLERAKELRFAPWAMSALERLIQGSNNSVTELLQREAELAVAVGMAGQGQRARTLLEGMLQQVAGDIAAVERKLEERRQRNHEKSVRHDANVADRAMKARSYKPSKKGGKKKGR